MDNVKGFVNMFIRDLQFYFYTRHFRAQVEPVFALFHLKPRGGVKRVVCLYTTCVTTVQKLILIETGC